MSTRRGPRPLFVDHTGVLGGAELSLLDIAAAYRDDGGVALFIDGPFRIELEQRGVEARLIDGGASLATVRKGTRLPALGAIGALWSIARALAKMARGYDLLYANSPKSFLVAALAGWRAQLPVVWHLRDILDRQHFSATNRRVLAWIANTFATRVIANSQATADAFVAAGGRATLVNVVHNGIDSAPFDQLPAGAGDRLRRELGIPAGAFVVGCFSRLNEWKGQRVLLDAIARTAGVHVLLVGGALFSGEEAYEAELRRTALSPALHGRAHLLGMRRDVPGLLAACDVVAHTSILPEPFGRVIVEAMLASRAVIASDAGGVREIVTDGRTGLLVPPGDAAALATAIGRLRDEPGLRDALVRAAHAEAVARFSLQTMLAGVASVIAECVR